MIDQSVALRKLSDGKYVCLSRIKDKEWFQFDKSEERQPDYCHFAIIGYFALFSA